MKRVFEIEFPDELGEMWMNQDNLMLCINSYCENKDGSIRATDVTSKVVYLSDNQRPLLIQSRYYSSVVPHEKSDNADYIKGQESYRDRVLKAGWRKVEVKDGS